MPADAVSMLVYFGSATATNVHDNVVLCKDSSCAEHWGSYSGASTNFPGIYPTDALSIPATSLFISFSSDLQFTEVGFDVTITPIYGTQSFCCYLMYVFIVICYFRFFKFFS